MKMLNTSYNVRYNVFKPTDRNDIHWHGYIYDVKSRKQKKWNTRETRKRDALNRVKERIEQIYGVGETVETSVRKFEPTTVGGICQKYLEKYYIPIKIADKSPKKQKKLAGNHRALINHIITHLGNQSVYSLHKTDIDEYIKKRKLEGAANGSVNREINAIKAAINRFVKNGKAPVIMDQIKGHHKLKTQPKQDVFSLEDIEKFILALPEYMRLMIEINLFTGARPGEIRNLKWSQIDFENCRINLEWNETKEGYEKSLKLPDRLMIALQALWKTTPKDDNDVPDCPYVSGKVISENQYYKVWHQTCRELGFTKMDSKKGKPVSKYTPHSLRRTMVTLNLKAGFDPKQIMTQTGHRTFKVFSQYNVVGEQAQEEMVAQQDKAWERLKRQETEKKEDFKERTEKAAKIADDKMKDLIWMVPEEYREKFMDVFKSSITSAIESEIGFEDLDKI
jgi:integrase